MFYMFVKRTSGWFCEEIYGNFNSAALRNKIMEDIENSYIVAFSDDIKNFAYEMKVDEKDTIMI